MHKPLSRIFLTLALTGAAVLSVGGQAVEQARQRAPEAEKQYGIKISLPHLARRPLPASVNTLLRRQDLTIVNERLAKGVTAVDFGAQPQGDAIHLRLSIIYNDISNQEWWKEKQETPLKTYTVREGETLRAQELEAFGIAPFEITVISVKPVKLRPGIDVPIDNRTQSLVVEGIVKHLDHYTVQLKNLSGKRLRSYYVMYNITPHGGSGIGADGTLSDLAGAATPDRREVELRFHDDDLEKRGIVIRMAMFEDWTWEGEERDVLPLLAKREGARRQAPNALAMLTEFLRLSDDQLVEGFAALESSFWQMPEAISKAAAVELLKERFPALDERRISELYEHLKAGLYEARNVTLRQLGNFKQIVEGMQVRQLDGKEQAQRIRERVEDIKAQYERILASLQ